MDSHSSASSSFFQTIWQSCFSVFEKEFNATEKTEPRIRKRFAAAAIAALEKYKLTSKRTHLNEYGAPQEVGLIEELSQCDTYQKLLEIIEEFPTKETLDEFIKQDLVDQDLAYLLMNMRQKFQATPCHALDTFSAKSRFSFAALEEFTQDTEVSSGEYIAVAKERYINFAPDGRTCEPKSYAIQLRLSVDEAFYSYAWDIIIDALLDKDSPFDSFQMLNSFYVDNEVKQLEDYDAIKNKYAEQGELITPGAHEMMVKELKKINDGEQVILHLPVNIEDEKIARFLQNITEKLGGFPAGKTFSTSHQINKYLVVDLKDKDDPVIEKLENVLRTHAAPAP